LKIVQTSHRSSAATPAEYLGARHQSCLQQVLYSHALIRRCYGPFMPKLMDLCALSGS
jgi:hypothetical protein